MEVKKQGRRVGVSRTRAVSQDAAPPALATTAIAVRAYQLFLERGMTHGSDLEDWLRAERELRPSDTGRRKKAS